MLAIKLRGVLLINFYLHHSAERSRSEIMADMTDLSSSLIHEYEDTARIIMAGDANCRDHVEELVELMAVLDFQPVQNTAH